MKARIIPPPLKKGDCIRIVAPAGQLTDRENFRKGLSVLREFGFAVNYPPELWPGSDFLADHDSSRAEEFNRALREDNSSAVMALRGGYGCLRLLAKIDTASVSPRPKMLIGFSDITILQNHLFQTLGLLSLHGPVVTTLSTCTTAALERFIQCLSGNWHGAMSCRNIEILRGGHDAQGPLIGGNLASLTSLLGTDFDFPWDGAIVLLEDINEPAYRLDRMLSQLSLAGKFNRVAGILLGDFSLTSQESRAEKIRHTEYVWNRVLDLTAGIQIPVWGNISAGHCPENLTLPIGAATHMHNGSATLHFS